MLIPILLGLDRGCVLINFLMCVILEKFFSLKFTDRLEQLRLNPTKVYKSLKLYFKNESRFGMPFFIFFVRILLNP
jgi:hypothetical protein